eukprot:716449-Prymnesium_polylepis.1
MRQARTHAIGPHTRSVRAGGGIAHNTGRVACQPVIGCWLASNGEVVVVHPRELLVVVGVAQLADVVRGEVGVPLLVRLRHVGKALRHLGVLKDLLLGRRRRLLLAFDELVHSDDGAQVGHVLGDDGGRPCGRDGGQRATRAQRLGAAVPRRAAPGWRTDGRADADGHVAEDSRARAQHRARADRRVTLGAARWLARRAQCHLRSAARGALAARPVCGGLPKVGGRPHPHSTPQLATLRARAAGARCRRRRVRVWARGAWCRMYRSLPRTAVPPITTPVPWSSITPLPICAPGWISTANSSLARDCSISAAPLFAELPVRHSACATRYATARGHGPPHVKRAHLARTAMVRRHTERVEAFEEERGLQHAVRRWVDDVAPARPTHHTFGGARLQPTDACAADKMPPCRQKSCGFAADALEAVVGLLGARVAAGVEVGVGVEVEVGI